MFGSKYKKGNYVNSGSKPKKLDYVAYILNKTKMGEWNYKYVNIPP